MSGHENSGDDQPEIHTPMPSDTQTQYHPNPTAVSQEQGYQVTETTPTTLPEALTLIQDLRLQNTLLGEKMSEIEHDVTQAGALAKAAKDRANAS